MKLFRVLFPFFLLLGLASSAHAAAPSIINIQPEIVTINQTVHITADVADQGSGVGTCYMHIYLTNADVFFNKQSVGSGEYLISKDYVFPTAEDYEVIFRCLAASGPDTGETEFQFQVLPDTAKPSVSISAPFTSTVNQERGITAMATDNAAIDNCKLYRDGSLVANALVLSNGTAQATTTFTNTGSFQIKFECTDKNGNIGSETRTFTVSSAPSTDTTPPTVVYTGPTSILQNSTVPLTATYSDNVGVTSCTLFMNGLSHGAMTLNNGIAQQDRAFTVTGTHTVEVQCKDAANNSRSAIINVQVNSQGTTPPQSGEDTSPPSISIVSSSDVTEGHTMTFRANVFDNVGVSGCTFYTNNTYRGPMTVSGTETFRDVTWSNQGTFTAEVRCWDAAGNAGTATQFVTVQPVDTGTPPAQDGVRPSVIIHDLQGAMAGEAVAVTASYSDNVGVTECSLFVDGQDQGRMLLTGTIAHLSHTFTSAGSKNIAVTCYDAARNSSTANRTMAVLQGMNQVPVSGSLIKLACRDGAPIDDPCRAVYYYSGSNRRHTFPNERVFFTWYANFDSVRRVSNAFLSSIPLGSNVTYRPGVRMVKFQTAPTVYAVTRGGILRPIATEGLAVQLYGPSWNEQIDDIADAFYSNYEFGNAINSSGDYSVSGEFNSTTSIEQNFR